MRFFPLITALLVTVAIYMAVMERSTLLGFAGIASEVAAPDATAPAASDTPRVRVLAQRSQAQAMEAGVILRGRTEAMRQVDVRAETAGLVISEPLRKGARVAAGDPLCELAPSVRKAALSEAQARLSEAEIAYRAASGLSESGFASDTRLAGARAALQAAQAGVERAVEEMARLVMHAPFDGILESDTAELGSLLQPGGLCATLIQLDQIRLVGYVTELQVDTLRVGASAMAKLASGQTVMGEVSFIARAADPQTRTFRVDVTVPNPDLSLRAGLSADIGIAAETARGHLLPGSALTLNDDGQLGLRLVDDAGLVGFAPVQVLRDTPDGMWLAGLPETANVIVVGQEFTHDGAIVDVVWRDATEAAQ